MRWDWGSLVIVGLSGIAASCLLLEPRAAISSDLSLAQAGPGPRGPSGPAASPTRPGAGGPRGPGVGRPGAPQRPEAGSDEAQKSAVGWTDVQVHLRAGAGRNFDAVIASALDQTARLGRRVLVLVPQPFPYEGANPNAHDYDVFLNSVKRNPGQLAFLGGAKLNAMLQSTDPKAVTDQIRRQFMAQAVKTLDDGARGFGELAVLHFSEFEGHPYEGVQPDHPLLLELTDLAAARNAVVAIHMEMVEHDMDLPKGLASPPNPPRLTENISAFERLISHNQNAKIVWLHNGWDNTGQRTPELVGRLMATHPNLSLALKFHRSRFSQNGLIIGAGLNPGWNNIMQTYSDRVMIGSDSFFAGPANLAGAKFEPQPMMVLLSRLPSPLLEKVAFQNAERIYDLSAQ